jgi:hypothetical protein
MVWINNGDAGSAVRAKLNSIPNDGTNCTAVAPVPLPFVGTAPVNGWTRPALSTFSTWLNQGDAIASDGTGGLPIILRSDMAVSTQNVLGGNLIGVFKASSVPPYTITVAAAGSGNITAQPASIPASEVSQMWAPIILYNSISGVALAFGWGPKYGQGGNGVNLWVYSNTASGNTPGYWGSQGNGFPMGQYFEWFRLSNDGTNITLSISDDGQEWQEWFVDTLADISSGTGGVTTFDKVGFGFDTAMTAGLANANLNPPIQTLANSFQSAKLWQWVETP